MHQNNLQAMFSNACTQYHVFLSQSYIFKLIQVADGCTREL